VIEDSRNGVLAAKAAGLRVVATTNHYTEKEDLSDAAIILTSLGDPDGEKAQLKKGEANLKFPPPGRLTSQPPGQDGGRSEVMGMTESHRPGSAGLCLHQAGRIGKRLCLLSSLFHSRTRSSYLIRA
jgi:hypothetical protein